MKILLLLLLVALVYSEGLTFTELQEKLLQQLTSPFVSLMFIYDGSTQMGPNLRLEIEEIAKKREDYFKVIAIDCNTDDEDLIKNFPYCGPQIRSQLPALFFTQPNINQADPTKSDGAEPKNHVYQGTLQEKALYDFAVPLMKLYSINLKKSSDWSKFKQSYPGTPKVIYFTDKDKISPFFKTLTAHFRNTIAFAHVFKNSTLCQQLGVTQFPSLLLSGQEKIELTSDLRAQIDILKNYEGPQARIVIQQFRDSIVSLDQSNLQQKIYENPRHILIHLPSADGKAHPEWKKCQQNFRKIFDYFETETLAIRLGVKNRPAIVYFPKSLAKKDVKKSVFHPSDPFRTIYDQISGLIQDFTIPLAGDLELQQMLSLSIKQGKFVAVLFHKQQISLSYRVLSNQDKFKQNIVFVRMKNPDNEVTKKFQLKKLPALFVMTKADENDTEIQSKSKKVESQQEKSTYKLQIAQYTGKFNYDDLERYLNFFVEKPEQQSTKSQKKVLQLSSKKKFQSACTVQACYILLLDNSPQKKIGNEQYIKVIQNSLTDVYQSVGFVDAKCHSELIAKLQIQVEQLPVLIYLNSKFEKYSRLVGRIEQKSIEAFVTKNKANKGIWRPYDKLIFQNKNCEQQHEKLKKLESSYEMSAEQAEILQEIRRQEQKKNKEAQAAEKGSKGKRRKRRPKEQQSEL